MNDILSTWYKKFNVRAYNYLRSPQKARTYSGLVKPTIRYDAARAVCTIMQPLTRGVEVLSRVLIWVAPFVIARKLLSLPRGFASFPCRLPAGGTITLKTKRASGVGRTKNKDFRALLRTADIALQDSAGPLKKDTYFQRSSKPSHPRTTRRRLFLRWYTIVV